MVNARFGFSGGVTILTVTKHLLPVVFISFPPNFIQNFVPFVISSKPYSISLIDCSVVSKSGAMRAWAACSKA